MNCSMCGSALMILGSQMRCGNLACSTNNPSYSAFPDRLEADLGALRAERDRYREALMRLFPVEEGFTEAFDDLIALGLLVEVPADEVFRAEWDANTMYAWAWSEIARRALATTESHEEGT